MKVTINDKEKEIQENVSIIELLKLENVKMPDMVSVELNGVILKRDEFEKTGVKENDKINFLYFMGGG